MPLRIYNTLGRRKEEFAPLHPGEVGIYVCGPNLYGPSHVGHAMSYIVFDVICRYLSYRGLRVTFIQNFTDIEDRIIETARAEGTTIEALAARYQDRFLREMDALGVARATQYPRATEAIPKMIEVIKRLIERGLAYAADGDVFFRVRAFPAYGRLSGRSLDEMQAGARIEVDPRKEHPMDFVLWKASKPDEPAWDSPWGQGRPGWHIECTTMSISALGEQFDIHGGGQDVIFPHHENELAQSEGYTGKSPFVRFWVHNGLLRLTGGDEKMTRHLGNFVSIQEALERYHPDAIRVFMLSSHYRSPATWSEDALTAATRGAERLRTALENAEDILKTPAGHEPGGPVPSEPGAVKASGQAQARASGSAPRVDPGDLPRAAEASRAAFEAAMDDDFNTPGALAAMFDLAGVLNRVTGALSKGRDPLTPAHREALERGTAVLRELGGVLGLRLVPLVTPAQVAKLQDLAAELSRERPDLFARDQLTTLIPPDAGRAGDGHGDALARAGRLIEFIAVGRMEARRQKDWATGDRIRARLADVGVLLEDTPAGFKWRVR
jgi:cysteinyl-tRNA synthetase